MRTNTCYYGHTITVHIDQGLGSGRGTLGPAGVLKRLVIGVKNLLFLDLGGGGS